MGDVSQPTKRRQIVIDLCKRFPKASNKTLARRLANDYPQLFTDIESARSTVRYARGNVGKHNQGKATHKETFRHNRQAGELPALPKSEAKPWEPFVLKARRVLILSDLHVPFHHEGALSAALDYGDQFKPDAIFVNGDFFDFFQLSKFEKHPSISDVDHELAVGKAVWAHIRRRFPKARLYYKLGNHDERWAKYIYRAAPALSNVDQVIDGWHAPAGILDYRITVIDDQRPVLLGKLPVFHGHELGKGTGNAVSPARTAVLRAQHTILVGHSHQTSHQPITNIWHDEMFAWSTGCLCDLTPDYARVNKWNHGFATVEVDGNGDFDVTNLRIGKNLKVRSS